MNNYNEQKDEKGGFWSALSGLFRGGSSAMGGGASSGMGAAGGLFATKAGIVGMVLGGATIAAGVGVVYNFLGSGSKPVYSPELFQNSYYEEESAAAGLSRAQSKDRSSASASTLDMFRDQAKKDGLGGMASEAGGGEKAAAAARLKAAPSFGGGGRGGGGSSASAMPRMQNAGGMSGGIGGQFASMYKAPAGKGGDGKVSAMANSGAARAKGSPKYAIPNFNKRGAHAQAKYAGTMGAQARYSADASGARTSATEAFVGETSGAGDVGAGDGGSGMGGAGISNGSGLKGNDPSISGNNSTPAPPPPTPPSDVSPWNDILMNAVWWGLGAIGGILLTKVFANYSKTYAWMFWAALVACAAAIVAAAIVIAMGVKLLLGHGEPGDADYWAPQTMYGIALIAVGALLIMKALEALSGATKGASKEVKADATKTPPVEAKAANAGTKPFEGLSGINDIFKGM